MKYKDNKWSIVKDEEGLRVYIKCECGLKHDISLDRIGNFIGRGTDLQANHPSPLEGERER